MALFLSVCCAGSAWSLDLSSVTGCVSLPDRIVWYATPDVCATGSRLAYTDESTFAPGYEYWPFIITYDVNLVPTATRAPEFGGWARLPALSWTGEVLAMVRFDFQADLQGVWLYRDRYPAEEAWMQLTVDADVLDIDRLRWSPNGSCLVFARDGWLFQVDATGGGESPLGVPGETPSVGPDGRVVYSWNGDLWILDAGTPVAVTQTPALEAEPSWFLGGRWIVYASNEAQNWDIWARAIDSGRIVQLTTDTADDRQPAISETGDVLLFQSSRNCDHPNIWMATDLPDWTIAVEERSWGSMKRLYR
jgi:hypothetical protein